MNIAYILLAYGSLFLLGIIDNSRGPIYPELLNLFQIPKSQGALIFSLASLSGFLVSLFSEHWLRKLSALRATQVALLLDVFACLLMGTTTSGIEGFTQFLFSAMILGTAIGIKGITLNLLIFQSSGPSQLRRVLAGMHSMYGIASLFAPIVLGYLFQFNFEWRDYFLMLAFIAFTGLTLSFMVKENSYQFKPKKDLELNWGKILRYCSIFSLYVSAEMLISSRLVIYLTEVSHINKSHASYYLSGFFLCLLAGRIFFSIRHVKVHSYTLLNISLGASFVFSSIGIFFYAPILILNGLSMSFFFPAGMDWIASNEGERADFIVAKVMMSVSLGLVLMHFGFGIISDLLGLEQSIGLLLVLLGTSWYLLHKMGNNLEVHDINN